MRIKKALKFIEWRPFCAEGRSFWPLNKRAGDLFSPESSVNVHMARLNAQRRGSTYVGVSPSSPLRAEMII